MKFDNQSDLVFLYNKAYTHDKKDFGSLYVPSADLVSFITHCEDIFVSKFLTIMHTSKICFKLVNAILNSADLSWFTSSNCSSNIRSIVHSYIKMRILYAVKFFNQSLGELPRKKRSRKALKLEHL